MNYRNRFSIVLAAAIALCMVLPTAASACSNSAERQFAQLVNNARKQRGLRPLTLDRQLNRVSIKHSREMRNRTTLVHTLMSTLGRRITRETYYGENIAWTSGVGSMTAGEEARRVFRMFMNSTPHRANILRRSTYRHHGVGFVYSGSRVWVTHTFSGTNDPGTTLAANRC